MTPSLLLFIVTLSLVLFVSAAFSCRHGTKVYDRCGQLCVCRYGRLRECTRVRREFTTMSYFERYMYIQTIKGASTHPKYKAEYDKMITVHKILFFTSIHRRKHFLPWHRYFVWRYENLMRKIYCRFTLAYWDWGMDSGHPWRGNFSDVWSPTNYGLGGNGTEPSQCVETGPFREGKWKLTPSVDGLPCLKRKFTGNTPDTIAILQLLKTPVTDFAEFYSFFTTGFHDNVHCLILGTMCSTDSANAPEFFLHHGFIDKIWDDWQKKSISHRLVYFSTIKEKMPGTEYFPSDFLDLARHPDGVKVIYNERRERTKMMRKYRSYTVKMLSRLPGRDKFSFINPNAMDVFRTPQHERRMAHVVANRFSPRVKPIA